MIELAAEELKIVSDLLQQYVADREVRAFGSRVTGGAKPYSDLDLVVMGGEPLEVDTLIDLKDAFTESDLPFRVDLLDWCRVSPEFQVVIEKNAVVIQTAS